jgi:hypothetical protein
MSAVAFDGAQKRSRIAAFATTAKNTAARTARRIVTPHKAALKNLAQIPLTIVGTGCVDYAAFHLASGWGWLVTGISCVFIEQIIAEEDEDTL